MTKRIFASAWCLALALQAHAWQYAGIEAQVIRANGDGWVSVGISRAGLDGQKCSVNLRYEGAAKQQWRVDAANHGAEYVTERMAGGPGLARVSVQGVGQDCRWRAQVGGVTVASGIWRGANVGDGGDQVQVTATSDWKNGTAVGRVTVFGWSGGSTQYDWTAQSDVDAWRVSGCPVAMGGWLTNRQNYCLRK